MESTLKNMVLTLLLITLVSASALGLVYNATKGPIEAAKSANTTAALAKVLPAFDNNPAEDTVSVMLDGMQIIVYKGMSGGKPSGYAVSTITKTGFSGEIKMMVGLLPDGEIYNIVVLEQNETPGLGSKMTEDGNPLLVSFTGKNPSELNMAVRKDGGDIDAITASTISSKAYIDAVARAYRAFEAVAIGIDVRVDYIALVLPEYDNDPEKEIINVMVDNLPTEVYIATKEGVTVGYAVKSMSEMGYNGAVRLMVGFLPDGEIYNIAVMEQNETPGIGATMVEEDNVLLKSFKGKRAGDINISLKAAGGDVEAVSGATISSEAYVDAVKRAYLAFMSVIMWNAE